ncbi:hypothetical protein, partial [Acidiphilium sp.]|uniref:hypothetical protein n=1 Tax=Acidiphilium sp. TaxID=527 RepID=UPI003D00D8D3
PTPWVYSPSMAWTPPPYPTTLTEMFALSLRKLRETLCDQGKRLGIALPLIVLIMGRLGTLGSRIQRLIARGPHPARQSRPNPDAKPRERAPAKLPRNWPLAQFGPPPPLPRGFGALRRLIPHHQIIGYTMEIERLLTHPDMVALIETTPAIGRALRPLCHICGLKLPPNLALPKRARRRPAAPRKPRQRRPRPTPVFPPITSTPPPLGPGNHYFIPNPAIFKKS